MHKDKPIFAPLRVFHPGWFASPVRFPFLWAFGWWLLVQGLAWLEPVPDDLQMQFSWNYLALTHLCAIAGQLLLPFVAWFLVPKEQPGGRATTLLRLSMGASLWQLWTFPLTFAFTGSQGAIVLALGRELLWAGALALAIAGLRSPRGALTRLGLSLIWTLLFFFGGLGFALLPDIGSLGHLRMENLGTGQVCKGIPQLPPTRVETANWLISGDPGSVSPSRLALGERQIAMQVTPGKVLVRVGSAATPAPEDTTGTTRIDPNDGPILERLVASVPSIGSDSLRLGLLHGLVHRSIKYQRRYFPGTSSEILARGNGDCKAYAQVFCAGVRRLGYPARVVHGLLASQDGYYAHAWVSVKTSHGWQDWDPTSGDPFPDARYLRFSTPKEATGAFDGELAIFALDSISVTPGSSGTFKP